MNTSFLHSMHSSNSKTAVHFLALRVRVEPTARHVISKPHLQREMVYSEGKFTEPYPYIFLHYS